MLFSLRGNVVVANNNKKWVLEIWEHKIFNCLIHFENRKTFFIFAIFFCDQ